MPRLGFVVQTLSTGTLTVRLFLLGVFVFALACLASKAGRQRLATALNVTIIIGVILSVFFVAPRPLSEQPSPDSQELADVTRQLVAGNGYVTYFRDGRPLPPMYPPGFPLALAPFAATSNDYPANVQRGATFYASLYVAMAAIAATVLQGWRAGAVIALFIGVSPFARVEASLILSDALAAGLTVFLIALLGSPTPRRLSLAGFLAGAVVAVRLPLLLNLVALCVVVPGNARKRLLAYAAVPLTALALFNWRTYGSVLRTGYHYWASTEKFFHPAHSVIAPIQGDGPWIIPDALNGLLLQMYCPCPPGGPQSAMSNLGYYSSILAGLFWLFVPPLVPLIGARYMWEHRQTLPVRFAACVIGLSFLLFVFYNYQAARFMASAVTLLGVFAAARIARWTLAPQAAGKMPA